MCILFYVYYSLVPVCTACIVCIASAEICLSVSRFIYAVGTTTLSFLSLEGGEEEGKKELSEG